MKVNIIHRDCPSNLPNLAGNKKFISSRNLNVNLHPLAQIREIQRAVVASKIEKIFSKPLVCSLDGHQDSVKCLARCSSKINYIFSGTCDGEICLWDIASKHPIESIRAHKGFVRGLSMNNDDTVLLSCGDDSSIKAWSLSVHDSESSAELFQNHNSVSEIGNPHFRSLQITTGRTVELWDSNRSLPLHSFSWGDSANVIITGALNQAENSLVCASGDDNRVKLFDLRTSSHIHSMLMKMRTNSIQWNPAKPINYTIANEDHNLYTFDMRKLDKATMVHKDFVNAVLTLDYSPLGDEFVAGSYDRSLRLFRVSEGRSRCIYHSKRMQIVLATLFTLDSKYVISGSSDFSIRVWKKNASESLGPKTYNEESSISYREALKTRYADVPQVKKILKHKHLPKLIKTIKNRKEDIEKAENRKEKNRKLHSKRKENTSLTSEKNKNILSTEL